MATGPYFEIAKTASGYSAPITIASFDGSNGAGPRTELITDAAGDLFGTTNSGGANNDGTVFEIPKTSSGYGPLVTIASFSRRRRWRKREGPDRGRGGRSGLRAFGGANGVGTVFEIAKTGSGYGAPITLVTLDDRR